MCAYAAMASACESPQVPQAQQTPTTAQQPDQSKPASESEQEMMSAGYVLGFASLRRQPSDAKRVPDAGGKQVNNWLTTLYRGEKVDVVVQKGEWAQVRASDDTEAWTKVSGLISAKSTKLATLIEPARMFLRPNRTSLATGKKFEPGTLMFVMQSKGDFSKVNYGGEAWIKTTDLLTDSSETDAARLLYRIRHMQKKKDPAVGELIDLAKEEFKDTKVLGLLEQAEPEQPSSEEG